MRQVTLTRLDRLHLVGVDAIKIDVEGHEEATLEGAWETIERERPMLIIEIEERHHPGRSEQIIQHVVSRRYRCWYLMEGRLERFIPGEIARLQPSDLMPQPHGKAPTYVNNFFFVPNERTGEVRAIQRHLAGERSV